MALALYRRYRPSTFAEVVGQEHVTDPLRTALAAGRINHAYLFSGPRGCGKTSSARILARSLNCVQGPTPDPCGVCDSCVALAPNGPGSLDVTEMDAASHNGVDDARELRDRAHFAPVASRYRVFIIDEAHMVTTAAFNALLKVVEEPPEHLIFVFATTEPEKVLTTIRSRTHHYPFRLLPPSTLRGLLERICTDEGVTVEPAVYPLVVRAGGGSARDSLSVLDQLLAGADDAGVTYANAVGLLGVTDVAILDDVVDALGAHDAPAVFGAVDRLVEAGHDPRRFAADLLQRLRDLILTHAVPDAGERGLVDVPADEMERMVDQAQRLGPAALARHAELVHTALTEMRGATAPRLLLELVCARMLLPAASSEDAAMVQRLEGVERRLALGASGGAATGPGAEGADEPARFTRPSQRDGETPSRAGDLDATVDPPTDRPTATVASRDEPPRDAPRAPSRPEQARPEQARPEQARPEQSRPEPQQSRPQPPATPEAPAAPAAAAGTMDAAGLRRVWPEVMNQVRERNKPTHALLQNATVTAVEGTTVTLGMPTPPLARQLSQPNRADHVAAALGAVLSGQWRVEAVHGTGDGAGGGGASRPEPPARQRPDPPRRPERPRQEQQPERSTEAPREQARESGAREIRRPSRPAPEPSDVPPPPEPPPEDGDVTEEDMYNEAAADPGGAAGGTRVDPEEAAMELLTSQLGARRVDGR